MHKILPLASLLVLLQAGPTGTSASPLTPPSFSSSKARIASELKALHCNKSYYLDFKSPNHDISLYYSAPNTFVLITREGAAEYHLTDQHADLRLDQAEIHTKAFSYPLSANSQTDIFENAMASIYQVRHLLNCNDFKGKPTPKTTLEIIPN